MRLHIKNNRHGENAFRITPEEYHRAELRHPDVAARVDTLIDFDLDHFDESMATADALVTWDLPTDDLAERAPNLRWIHIIGAGVDHLAPLDWLPAVATLTNNRGVHEQKAGEYGLMALLMLNNEMPRLIGAQRDHRYIECFTTSIEAKTLLVLGAGNLGAAVATRVRRLGMRTIGIRRRPRRTPGFDEVFGPDEIDRLLPEADFVLLAAPATEQTRDLLDRRRVAMMKPGAGLVNMGRASLIDHDAVAEALRSAALTGAVLDVHDPEPLPARSALWAVPNLVLTPHVSSDDAGSYVPLTLDLVFENLGRMLGGRPLKNRVDPAAGY